MPTLPLPSGIVNKIKARQQAVRWSATLKEVRTFSAYCCNINSNGIMGVAKQPVPIVDISPNVVCLGEAIDWDLRSSYAPGSTVSAWEIDFGDGNSDNGASIGTAVGTHTYAAIGQYTVTITITEGLGKTAIQTREINVVDCTQPPDRWVYAATYGNGVWFLDRVNDATTWVSRNKGLSGDALYVNSMVMKPGQEHLSDGSHELWIATKDGVYKSGNSGKNWDKLDIPDPSNDEFEDTMIELTNWQHIIFDSADKDVVYVIAAGEGSADNPSLRDTETVATGGGPTDVWYSGFSPGLYLFDNYPGFPNFNQYRTQVAIDGSGNISLSGRGAILDSNPITLSVHLYNSGTDAMIAAGGFTYYIQPPTGSPIQDNVTGWHRSIDWLTTSSVIRILPPGGGSLVAWIKNWNAGGELERTYDFGITGAGAGQHVMRVDGTHALIVYLKDGVWNAKVAFTDIPNDTLVETASASGPACDTANVSSCVLLEETKYALVYTHAGQNHIVTVEVTGGGTAISWGSSAVMSGVNITAVTKVNSSTVGLAYVTNNGLVDRIEFATSSITGSVGTPIVIYTAPSLGVLITEPLSIGVDGSAVAVAYGDEVRNLKVASVGL